MPATYAAVTASLNALCEIHPEFAPISLLDVGAGPGTASWAAAEAFSSLQDFRLLDANDALRKLALDLVSDSFRLRKAVYERGEARGLLSRTEAADLVVASYMIGEIGDAEQAALAALMWAKTRDTLVVVEPGTPAGYARIIALRERLIAAGAHVAAPCPHDGKCPLAAPDWCHFTQRLQRSRAHKQIKGAELPFEDEKFAYVALTREPVTVRPSRVLAQPVVSKVEVTAKLCTPTGRHAGPDAAPRQGGLCPCPALALGRCGDGRTLKSLHPGQRLSHQSAKTRRALPDRNASDCSCDSPSPLSPARHFCGESIGQLVPNITRLLPIPFIQSTNAGGSRCRA